MYYHLPSWALLLAFSSVSYLSNQIITLAVAAIGLGYLAVNSVGWQLAPATPHKGFALLWGSLTGMTSYISHAGTPPYQAYLLAQKLPKMQYMGTSAIIFSVINCVKLPAYAMAGQLSADIGYALLILVPASIAGVYCGYRCIRMFSDTMFYTASKPCFWLCVCSWCGRWWVNQ